LGFRRAEASGQQLLLITVSHCLDLLVDVLGSAKVFSEAGDGLSHLEGPGHGHQVALV